MCDKCLILIKLNINTQKKCNVKTKKYNCIKNATDKNLNKVVGGRNRKHRF